MDEILERIFYGREKIAEENRVVYEMLEIAQALQSHALISSTDMAKLLQLTEK